MIKKQKTKKPSTKKTDPDEARFKWDNGDYARDQTLKFYLTLAVPFYVQTDRRNPG